MGGIFELRDYRDLMAKLERDLEAITENPRDSGFAFNFFVTAWHLLEWVYPDDVAKRAQIRDASILLQISEHIAVGAMHFEPTSKKHKSVTRTFRDTELSRKLFDAGQLDIAILTDRLMIDLDPNAAAEFGRDWVPAAGIAAMVVVFWREHLKQLGREK